MLRDRYDPLHLFDLVPILSLAMDPVLTQLDTLLDDDRLFQMVKADVAQRFPHTTTTGRPSTPVEVMLRMLLVKHLYGWSYEQTEQFVADSLALRQFCRVYAERVPDDTTLLRWANLIQPATRHRLLDHVVVLAQSLKVTRGRKLRIDGTVVETHIHHPTDSTLLNDGVRVLSRTLHKVKGVVQGTTTLARRALRDRTRSAKRQMTRIMEATRQRGVQADARMRTAYQQLLDITQAMVKQAKQVGAVLADQTTVSCRKLARTLDDMGLLVEQVMTQTTRRVLLGEAVPAQENVVSLFEPHTAIIRKGKPSRPTEFGRVIGLDEVDGGIVSRSAVLAGNPAEDAQLPPRVEHHLRLFHRPPRLLTGDRGLYNATNEPSATTHGVKEVVLPKPGAKSAKRIAHEQERWCRRGRNWRAGIEGRISGLKRRHKLDRCRNHGNDGMERWVGWGVIAHNLRTIAQAIAHETMVVAFEPRD